MIENLKIWIAKYDEVRAEEVESYFQNANVTGFLIIWTIFEQKKFGGLVKYNSLKSLLPFDTSSLSEQIAHFHDRYKCPKLYDNLKQSDSKPEIDDIIKKSIGELTQQDKCLFLLYVVYRYRNNIFHGNKGVNSWAQYTTEIQYCVDVMRTILSPDLP